MQPLIKTDPSSSYCLALLTGSVRFRGKRDSAVTLNQPSQVAAGRRRRSVFVTKGVYRIRDDSLRRFWIGKIVLNFSFKVAEVPLDGDVVLLVAVSL